MVIVVTQHFTGKQLTSNAQMNTLTSGRWHSDIKPANILSVCGRYKLADPGYASFRKVDEFTGGGLPMTVLSGGTETYGMQSELEPRSRKSHH